MAKTKNPDGIDYKLEDKNAKFRRVGSRRMRVALKRLQLIGNVFNRNVYSFTEEEAAKVLTALRDAVDILETKSKANVKTDPSFEFAD